MLQAVVTTIIVKIHALTSQGKKTHDLEYNLDELENSSDNEPMRFRT
jgi:hypothetical protein